MSRPDDPAENARLSAAGVISASARVGRFGALLGLGVSVVGQALVAALGSAPELGVQPAAAHRVVGAVFTACLFGGGLFAASCLTLGLSRPRRASVLRAGWVVVAFGAVAVIFHLLGLALRLLMGSALTRSGLEFFWNGASHIGAALWERYLLHVAALLLATAAVAALIRRGVRWAYQDGARPVRPAEVAGHLALVGGGLLVVGGPVPEAFGRGVGATSPELAFFASMASDHAREGHEGLVRSPLAAAVLQGPERGTGAAWREVAEGVGRRPNVVIVMLEAVAPSHVGYLGYDRPTTPNLDRIAEQSLRMTRAYSTATHSNYAQMAVLSSLFPRRGRALDMYHRLDYPRVLLHDLGHELGYRTATISSQDETWQGMIRFQTTDTPTHYFHAADHDGERIDIGTELVVPDHVTAARAARWIEEASGPVTLYVNLQATHFPYAVPGSWTKRFASDEPKHIFNYVSWHPDDMPAILAKYDNALAYVDEAVGVLYDALERTGRLDDTILVVTSDHGEMFAEHGVVTHGRTLYEGEARVPLLVHFPAALEPGDDPTPVSTLDVLPTVLELLELPPHPALQGESFAHAREGAQRGAAVFLNIQGWTHLEAIVCHPYKLVRDPGTHRTQLFDVEADPGELRDLARERPRVAAALRDTLEGQMEAQDAYHASAELKQRRFAPRLLPCPAEAAAR